MPVDPDKDAEASQKVGGTGDPDDQPDQGGDFEDDQEASKKVGGSGDPGDQPDQGGDFEDDQEASKKVGGTGDPNDGLGGTAPGSDGDDDDPSPPSGGGGGGGVSDFVINIGDTVGGVGADVSDTTASGFTGVVDGVTDTVVSTVDETPQSVGGTIGDIGTNIPSVFDGSGPSLDETVTGRDFTADQRASRRVGGSGNPDDGPATGGVIDRVESATGADIRAGLSDASESYTRRVADPFAETVGDATPGASIEQRVFGTNVTERAVEATAQGAAQLGNIPGAAVAAGDAVSRLDDDLSEGSLDATTTGPLTSTAIIPGEGTRAVAADFGRDVGDAASAAAANPIRTGGALFGAGVGGAVASQRAFGAASRVSRSRRASTPDTDSSLSLDERIAGAADRVPDVELTRDRSVGLVDINPEVGQSIRNRLPDAPSRPSVGGGDGITIPSQGVAGDSLSDIFGTAGQPRVGRAVRSPPDVDADVELPSQGVAGDSLSDIFGTAGRRSGSGSNVDLPSQGVAGDSLSDIFGTAPRAGSGPDVELPSQGTAGDTLGDIFGTAGRGPGPDGRTLRGALDDVELPSQGTAGDSLSDIFGTAPRAGSGRSVELPSQGTAGDSLSDIFGLAGRGPGPDGQTLRGALSDIDADSIPGVGSGGSGRAIAGDSLSDIFGTAGQPRVPRGPRRNPAPTIRIGGGRPRGGDTDVDAGADDVDTPGSAGSPIEVDVEAGGGGAGTGQLQTVRFRDRGGRTDTPTASRAAQRRNGPSGAAAAPAGVEIDPTNDPTNIADRGTPDFGVDELPGSSLGDTNSDSGGSGNDPTDITGDDDGVDVDPVNDPTGISDTRGGSDTTDSPTTTITTPLVDPTVDDVPGRISDTPQRDGIDAEVTAPIERRGPGDDETQVPGIVTDLEQPTDLRNPPVRQPINPPRIPTPTTPPPSTPTRRPPRRERDRNAPDPDELPELNVGVDSADFQFSAIGLAGADDALDEVFDGP